MIMTFTFAVVNSMEAKDNGIDHKNKIDKLTKIYMLEEKVKQQEKKIDWLLIELTKQYEKANSLYLFNPETGTDIDFPPNTTSRKATAKHELNITQIVSKIEKATAEANSKKTEI